MGMCREARAQAPRGAAPSLAPLPLFIFIYLPFIHCAAFSDLFVVRNMTHTNIVKEPAA
jgi:hypothetical protein